MPSQLSPGLASSSPGKRPSTNTHKPKLTFNRFPFYSWIRLGFLLYLILPQTQGAKVLYQSHVRPFLEKNERSIDDFISSAHENAKAAGYTYLKHAIELIKQHVLGLPPKEPSPPATPTRFTYAQSLIARFNLPSARPAVPTNPIPGATSTAGDFYTLLAAAANVVTSATSGSRDLSNSGTLIPPSMAAGERLPFIEEQRKRLGFLLSALDKEANTIEQSSSTRPTPRALPNMFFDGSDEEERPVSAMSGLSTRKSEPDFEKIDAESGAEDAGDNERPGLKRGGTVTGGSWLPWSWGAKAVEQHDKTVEQQDEHMSRTQKGEDQGKSSGLDY